MSIFEADPEGWRSQNADRPPEQLVRELVQNSLDEEGVQNLWVEVTYRGKRRGTTVVVRDDSPEGVKDPRLLFTIWLSDKQDQPTKRGRMGRGLKELVSVCDETQVRSCGCDAIVFERTQGGKWERHQRVSLGRPEKGTEVQAFCRAWGEAAAKRIVAFLQKVRPPQNLTMWVSYKDLRAGTDTGVQQVRPFVATERYEMKLSTCVFEAVNGERAERERQRDTVVECFLPPPGEKAWVYEMGIPVEECDSPVSIDVGQRVILRERRDTLTEVYKRRLFAQILSQRITSGLVADAQLRDNYAVTAAADSGGLSWEAKQRLVAVWTGGKPFAADPKMRALATGHHVEVVNLRSLPESVRDIVRWHGQDVKTVLEQRRAEFCPELKSLDVEQRRLKTFWEWIAAGIGRPCEVRVCGGNSGASADFERAARMLSLYPACLGKDFFQKPAGATALSLLIHEISHWEAREDEHGSDFAHDNDDVGGAVAAFLLGAAEQARLLLAGS